MQGAAQFCPGPQSAFVTRTLNVQDLPGSARTCPLCPPLVTCHVYLQRPLRGQQPYCLHLPLLPYGSSCTSRSCPMGMPVGMPRATLHATCPACPGLGRIAAAAPPCSSRSRLQVFTLTNSTTINYERGTVVHLTFTRRATPPLCLPPACNVVLYRSARIGPQQQPWYPTTYGTWPPTSPFPQPWIGPWLHSTDALIPPSG